MCKYKTIIIYNLFFSCRADKYFFLNEPEKQAEQNVKSILFLGLCDPGGRARLRHCRGWQPGTYSAIQRT